MENWKDLCSVIHKGSPSFAVMREDGHVITADSFEELIEAVKNDVRVRPRSKNGIVWITRLGKKIPIKNGKTPDGRAYIPQVGSVIRVQGDKGVVNYTVVGGNAFKRTLLKAKESISADKRWRVDDTYSPDDYKGVKTYTTKGGSTIAVKKNGDIVSVCKNSSDTATGTDLLKFAVANGGTKLDSFDGNYKFYCKNGFEPVSWTKFNPEYAPHDWPGGAHEQVIFFKYTGKQYKKSLVNFLKDTNPIEDYDEAMAVRDRSMM